MNWREANSPSAENGGVLDVKPLKTLSPMFPASPGINTFSKSKSSPFILVNPSESGSSLPTGFTSAFAQFSTPHQQQPQQQVPLNARPINATPLQATPISNGPRRRFYSNGSANDAEEDGDGDDDRDTDYVSPSGRKRRKSTRLRGYLGGSDSVTDGSGSGRELTKLPRRKPKSLQINHLVPMPSLLDPNDSAGVVLMTFDAIRRKLHQVFEGKDDKNQRPDLTAANLMMTMDLRANKGKRIGHVPGVEIGDVFFFRMELCLVGLHAPSMAGIDYIAGSDNTGVDNVAVSVVSAGVYENEESDVNLLIYSGQGGNANIDQKLERGNLALEKSWRKGNLVRVIRAAKDLTLPNGRIYYYDGLYKVHNTWIEKGKAGFNVFKFKLLREPEQAPGHETWKNVQQWKDNPASRRGLILRDISNGVENIPVCLVNEVDGERGPKNFRYNSRVDYLRPLSSMKPLEICRCASVCLPGDIGCTCAKLNNGYLPYSSLGALVSRKPMIYECNGSCSCTMNCRNRVTQKGVRYQFEVFKTRDRGWGLRSWDPIRAGTFICEYTGEVITKSTLDDLNAEDSEYIFQANGANDRAFQWNYGPELLTDLNASADQSSGTLGPLPIIISSKYTGNISRFMNHSCSPNVFWQPVLHDHGDEGFPHIMFFAMKHIPPMVELTFDYGTSAGAESHRTKKCLCGSPKCRGHFG